MEFSNGDRSQHGLSAQAGLEYLLTHCIDLNYLTKFDKNFRTGIEGYTNTAQFYVPFLVHFSDDTKWALFTTTSMRTDRVKGQQWDASNIKNIMPDVTRAYLVYPDGLNETAAAEFIRQDNKYRTGYEYSAIDGVVSQNQIINMIEAYALSSLSSGQFRDRRGNNYEVRIANILSSPDNFEKWKTGNRTLVGTHYDVFLEIVNCVGIYKEAVTNISATADKRIIGRLPSGGNPKTDVLVTLSFNDGSFNTFGISCKRSTDQSVSVHQYNATAFANVLNSEDNNLRALLQGFQDAGSMRAFGENNCIALEDALAPYHEQLALWVLGGWGGEGTRDQCAQFILTYNDSTGNASIHEVRDYYCNLVAAGVTGNFGTIFSWTYPSKRRGMDIQLKCRII